ncbi:ArsR/SmtB family transcription factor [Leucobacter sp. M11]|uniref:ArsR/SmtB family transcription factor n=1 Tax=Leucobacter sp. M11 TaxID=2993565 RepID=UPI002D7E5645|nr:metalloregulator ArsR/SmtB family transcription factor [Leucobacter sp. M11]MEB4614679.1 metalloregulator ArsR/SmtB family transcription factor [Leucobacter sp. M11]
MPDIFSVIADPTRRDILQILLERFQQGQEISVSDIVAQLETSQPTVSKHLKVLREAELVSVREEGQHRFYGLTPEPLEMVEDYVIPFLSVGMNAEVTVEYVTEEAEGEPVLSEDVLETAEGLGRAVARAENQVKELVARFRLRG